MSRSRTARGFWITLVVICALTLSVPAQAAAQDAALRIAVGWPRTADDQPNRRLETLLQNSIISELRALGFVVAGVAAAADPPVAPGDRPDEHPDMHLDVLYAAGPVRLTLVLSVTETVSDGVVAGGSWTGTMDLALINVVRQAADEIAHQIRSAAAVSEPYPQPPRVLQQLRLRSVNEGMTVYLSDEVQLGVIEDGMLDVPFIPVLLGSQLQVRKQLAGYHDQTETLEITAERLDVQLSPLRPQVGWEMSLSWMPQRWAGAAVGLRRYLVPERFYAQSTSQLSTRYRFAAGSRGSGVLDTRLSLGGYPIAVRGGFSLGASTGVGVTLSLLAGEGTAYLFADPYLNVVSLSAKWQFERLAPFIQWDLVHYGEAGTGYLLSGAYEYISAGVLLPWQP
ncbi:MAG: hypothetical protein EA384_10490 [Spirochaetaceae bacterium]|nr:MAG: hypothetical protein EA384_10490 [Spirochaetaceae bacterium]